MSEEADEIPAYACCSIGIGRWFWVAWGSESEARTSSPALASGYEATAAAAGRKATEAAGPRTKNLPAKWASAYKRRGAVAARTGGTREDADGGSKIRPRARMTRPGGAPGNGAGATRLAFLYAASESDRPDAPGQVVVVRHRIVRQNARKFYVEREPFREEDWAQRAEGGGGSPAGAPKPRTLAVDRDTLRREGRFPHRRSHRESYFYASEEDGIRAVQAALTSKHAWCAALGVRFPCSAESVKSAYRRLVRTAHPDVGGDPARFRAVEQAYREALAYFARVDGATPPTDAG
jgi:hypothetical protein